MRATKWLVVIGIVFLASSLPAWVSSAQDTQLPSLVSFDFAPRAIDTSFSSQSITFTVHFTDDLGVSSAQALFKSASGQQQRSVYFHEQDLVSGTLQDGVFLSAMTMTQYSESGTWQLAYLDLGSQSRMSRAFAPSELIERGFPITFTVAPGGDGILPTLASFDLSPRTIDTSLSQQTITFTAHLTDDLSGLATGPYATLAHFASPSPSQRTLVSVVFDPELHLVSGNGVDGFYQSLLTLPRYSPSGVWHLDWFWRSDTAGNRKPLSEQEMIALGFPTTFTVAPGGDAEPPAMAAFDFEPKTIDVSRGPKMITVTMRVTDNLSGLNAMMRSTLHFSSPYTHQSSRILFTPADRYSGTAQDGTYVMPMTLSPSSEAGTWVLLYWVLTDEVGNTLFLNEDGIRALGFPTKFEVVNRPLYFPLVGR